MKRTTCVLIVISLLFLLSGCSVFVSTPRVARIEIQGLDNQLNEYIVALDGPADSNLGFHLTNRYTIQLDFQWLWNSNKPIELDVKNQEDHAIPPLSPWMLCRYRF